MSAEHFPEPREFGVQRDENDDTTPHRSTSASRPVTRLNATSDFSSWCGAACMNFALSKVLFRVDRHRPFMPQNPRLLGMGNHFA